VTFFCEAGVATRWSTAINIAEGADDMNDHDEWISYSHWGMFALDKSSDLRRPAPTRWRWRRVRIPAFTRVAALNLGMLV